LVPISRFAIVTIAFFGSCAGRCPARSCGASCAPNAPTPDRVELLGGIALRPSRLLIGGIGAWIGGLGVIMFVFGSQYGLLLLGLGLGMAVLGCFHPGPELSSAGLPTEYLRFDPSGITLGQAPLCLHGPVGQHRSAKHGRDQPQSRDPDTAASARSGLKSRHPQRMAQARKELSRLTGCMGAHVLLAPVQYRMDASLLVQALDRYVPGAPRPQ